ncbi:hypothetical protein FB106_1278 [Synechococcus sp. Ace-Pa]|nr:hypothetical protein FB106_1278 [Synechococcus sp. Ace-Pa]
MTQHCHLGSPNQLLDRTATPTSFVLTERSTGNIQGHFVTKAVTFLILLGQGPVTSTKRLTGIHRKRFAKQRKFAQRRPIDCARNNTQMSRTTLPAILLGALIATHGETAVRSEIVKRNVNPYHSDQSDQKKFNVAVEKNASLAGILHRIVLHIAGIASVCLSGICVHSASKYFSGAGNPSSYQLLAEVFIITTFAMPFLILFAWYLNKQASLLLRSERILISAEFLSIPIVAGFVFVMCLLGFKPS